MVNFNEITQKTMGKFVTDLQFRNSVLQTPALMLAQEGVSPTEAQQLTSQLNNITAAQLKTFYSDGPLQTPWDGDWITNNL